MKTWYFCIYNRNSLNSSIFRKTVTATLSVLEKIRRKWRVQVCAKLEQDNLEQELNGLLEAMDFFGFKKGTLVTLSQTDTFIRDA